MTSEMADDLTTRTEAFILQNTLLAKDGLHLVALSGGADSVALLLLLLRLGYRVHAAHCNFSLRGEESLRDELFVKDLCARLGVRLSIAHFDTRTYAEAHKVSIEMAARELRYAYFEQLRRDLGAETICVAHHRDDSVETVLLNLVRGTGIEGLTGIKARNGHIVRPLLCISRKEIVEWLGKQEQPYVTDSTNLVADVMRNQLRLNIIPQLEQMLPGATANISRTAQWVAEANKVYRHAMDEALHTLVSDNSIELAVLPTLPSAECLLFEWLSPMGFSPATISAISRRIADRGNPLRQGMQWLSASHQLVMHNGRLTAAPLAQQRPTLRLPEPGVYIYNNEELRLTAELREGAIISRDPMTASLDADRTPFPLVLRPVQQGDRFRPFGMKGTKLVSDFMTDAKLSPIDKQRQLVMTTADGHIVWLVGRRPDGRYAIGPDTKRTIIITAHRNVTPNS